MDSDIKYLITSILKYFIKDKFHFWKFDKSYHWLLWWINSNHNNESLARFNITYNRGKNYAAFVYLNYLVDNK